MSYIMVDIEADGPIPGVFSMVSFGAVVVDESFDKTFYREIKPISDQYNIEALSISGITREQSLSFSDPSEAMQQFNEWISLVSVGKPFFISDNNGFDWMFICWYFHNFIGSNPFGYSSTNLNSLYRGVVKDVSKSFQHLMNGDELPHNALEDAILNAQVAYRICNEYGLKGIL